MQVEVGVLLPNGVPGCDPATVQAWVRTAEQGPFSCIGVADRVAYTNHESMMTLAAAAAVTQRVRLLTSALLTPLRGTAMVTKQVATLAAMAPGRLSLGVAVGARQSDFEATEVPWEARGALLDRHLDALAAQRTPADPEQSVGPALGQIEVLIGGASAPALKRLVRHGDGYIAGGINPDVFAAETAASLGAWAAAGRSGRPRMVAGTWFARSEDSDDLAAHRQQSYLLQGGPPPFIRGPIARGRDGVEATIRAYREQGADEVVFFPLLDDVADLEWLADVVAGLPEMERGEPVVPEWMRQGPPPPSGPPAPRLARSSVTMPLPGATLRARREAVVAEHIRAETAGDLDATLATFPGGASYTIVPLGREHSGDDEVRGLLGELLAGFPDLALTPVRVHHSADAVVVEGVMTGTHTADWGGIAASGKQLDLPAAVFFRFDGDQLLNETVYYDHLTAVQQLSDRQQTVDAPV